MTRRLLILLAFAVPASAAEAPPACAPSESLEMCGLIVQRNNALNDLINAQAAASRLDDRLAQTRAYWKAYLDGEEAQRQQAVLSNARELNERTARAAEAARGHMR